MPFFISYFHSVNIGTLPRLITGKKLDTWDISLYLHRESIGGFVTEPLRERGGLFLNTQKREMASLPIQ